MVLRYFKAFPPNDAAIDCLPRIFAYLLGLRSKLDGCGAVQAFDWVLGQRAEMEET